MIREHVDRLALVFRSGSTQQSRFDTELIMNDASYRVLEIGEFTRDVVSSHSVYIRRMLTTLFAKQRTLSRPCI